MSYSSVQDSITTARTKKEEGDKCFQAGDLSAALRSYHEALLYLKGLNSNTSEVVAGSYGDKAPPSQEKQEIDEMLEKVYSNMSACLIKQGKWQRAIDSADKVLAINENNYKAIFRKGKALGELGFFEKSYKLLDTLLEKNPADTPTINAELARFKAKEKTLEKAANEKLRGFLNRDKSPLAKDTA